MEFGSLAGKRIVVTGASTGIGAAIACECAAAGGDLLITWRTSEEEAGSVVRRIRAMGRSAEMQQLELAEEESCRALVRAAFDLGRVDGVVLNAGADLLTGETREADYLSKLQLLLDVDVRGTVRLGRDFGQRLQRQQGGCLLTLGWDQSDRGMEGDSGELFATAKNAIMGFSRSLAVSLAPDVRVNCIAPGWIRTEWGDSAGEYWQQRVLQETPLRRWGEPQDIANVARFLLSDAASYLTGQVLNVNGGAVR